MSLTRSHCNDEQRTARARLSLGDVLRDRRNLYRRSLYRRSLLLTSPDQWPIRCARRAGVLVARMGRLERFRCDGSPCRAWLVAGCPSRRRKPQVLVCIPWIRKSK